MSPRVLLYDFYWLQVFMELQKIEFMSHIIKKLFRILRFVFVGNRTKECFVRGKRHACFLLGKTQIVSAESQTCSKGKTPPKNRDLLPNRENKNGAYYANIIHSTKTLK